MNSLYALTTTENDSIEQQEVQDDVVASRAFRSEGLKNFLDNLKELDQSLVVEEEAKQAAEKAQAKRDKKYATVRFMKKMFGKSNNKSQRRLPVQEPQSQLLPEPLNEKIDEVQRPEDLEDVIHPSPYVNPLKYRLLPRKEQSNLMPSSINALIRTNPNAPLSAITIARNRGEAALALFGTQTVSADSSGATSLRENSLPSRAARYRGSSDVESIDISQPLSINIDAALAYDREEMSFSPSYEPDEPKGNKQQVVQYSMQDLENVVIRMAQGPSYHAAWRQYIDSYSLVRIYFHMQKCWCADLCF